MNVECAVMKIKARSGPNKWSLQYNAISNCSQPVQVTGTACVGLLRTSEIKTVTSVIGPTRRRIDYHHRGLQTRLRLR